MEPSTLCSTSPPGAVKMSVDTKSMHITPSGGNVFADLGFSPEETAALKLRSQRVIAAKGQGKTNPVYFDTLKFVKTLRDSGVQEEQAIAICKATHDALRQSLENYSSRPKVRSRDRRPLIDIDALFFGPFLICVVLGVLLILKR